MMSGRLKENDKRRVVVTGLGVISSLGIGWQEFWKNLIAGKSGISKVESFDTSQYDRHYGGEVKNFDPTQFMSKRKASRMGRASQMAIAASKLALEDAGVSRKKFTNFNSGVCFGTTLGESKVIERFSQKMFEKSFDKKADILLPLIYPANIISNRVAVELKATGNNYLFSNACTAGNCSIARAYDLIKDKRANMMLAGGSDAFSRIAFTGFYRLSAIAPKKCSPFDKNRQGMIPGEGAGALLLEDLMSAESRKAKIYAEVKGYGLSNNARHMVTPDVEGIISVMEEALRLSGVSRSKIDYIIAHGTGTKENDSDESQAIRDVFGERVPISSIKSMLGHSMGTASILEAITCCLVICKNILPPTINYETFDDECNLDVVPNVARHKKVRVVMNNSFAFGGNNTSLVIGCLNV